LSYGRLSRVRRNDRESYPPASASAKSHLNQEAGSTASPRHTASV